FLLTSTSSSSWELALLPSVSLVKSSSSSSSLVFQRNRPASNSGSSTRRVSLPTTVATSWLITSSTSLAPITMASNLLPLRSLLTMLSQPASWVSAPPALSSLNPSSARWPRSPHVQSSSLYPTLSTRLNALSRRP